MNAHELLKFCEGHIRCDVCGTEGGIFDPAKDMFICPNDQQLLGRFQALAKEEQENG